MGECCTPTKLFQHKESQTCNTHSATGTSKPFIDMNLSSMHSNPVKKMLS